MREGAECGGKSDVLPANQSVRRRGVSDNAPNLSGKAGKTLWEYPSLPEIE
ncbi:TPA: hypothetical protein WMW48_002204, partial [Neisseria gonorrhoeae]